MGKQSKATALGLFLFTSSFTSIVGMPFAGYILDVVKRRWYFVLAACAGLSLCILVLALLADVMIAFFAACLLGQWAYMIIITAFVSVFIMLNCLEWYDAGLVYKQAVWIGSWFDWYHGVIGQCFFHCLVWILV